MTKPFYITTPIYYVNDKPHIGHAYTSLACDVLARFKRLSGEPVYFLTGTDEHGQKIEKSAEKAGMDCQAFCDMNAAHFKNLAATMNFSNDDFIRTTEDRHKKGAQAFWKAIEPYIYLDKYAGWYAVRDEAYYQESELVNGKAPTGADVEWVEEESYFFKLSEFTQPLLDFYENNPTFVQPESRFNEVKRFVEGGLKDLSISRTTFKWGIPVPNNEKHVMYVWLDALTNYLTAIGYPFSSLPAGEGLGVRESGTEGGDAAHEKRPRRFENRRGLFVRGSLRRRREVSRRSGQLNLSTAPIFYLYPRAFSSVTGYALVSERLGRPGVIHSPRKSSGGQL